ncbi:MAG: OsmC family peroxiredoxin [Comamonadaceae bacterium]|nr:MAG: OsmC family peroxiredoxin [Comamonadaceae bacterium]
MSTAPIAAALERMTSVLQRRPDTGLHDDAPATARWDGGTRVVALHGNGHQVPTDMPAEFGGTGGQVTPGWLFRAGVAACATTSIALLAAKEGIELTRLETRAGSRSDARGMLGMTEADGSEVSAAPGDFQLHVRIAAQGVPPETLRALVERGLHRSPIPSAVQRALPLAFHIDLD